MKRSGSESDSLDYVVNSTSAMLKAFGELIERTLGLMSYVAADGSQINQAKRTGDVEALDEGLQLIDRVEKQLDFLDSNELKAIGLPIADKAIWNTPLLSLLNLLLKELFPKDLPFSFIIQNQENKCILMIESTNKMVSNREMLREIIDQMIVKLEEVKVSLLTESEWQLLPSADKYYHRSLSPDIVLQLLKLYMLHVNAFKTKNLIIKELIIDSETLPDGSKSTLRVCLGGADIVEVLYKRFGFTNIYLPMPSNILGQLEDRYVALLEKIKGGGFTNDKTVKDQLKIIEEIFKIVSTKPSAKMYYSYYQFAKAGIEIQLLMNKVHSAKLLSSLDAIQIKKELERIRSVCMSLPFSDFADEHFLYIVAGLGMMATINGLNVSEEDITQCESDVKRSNLLAQVCVNMEMLQNLSKRLIAHGKECLMQNRFQRLDSMCSPFQHQLFSCDQDLQLSPSLENIAKSEGLMSLVLGMYTIDENMPPRPWQLEILKVFHHKMHSGIFAMMGSKFSNTLCGMGMVKQITNWGATSASFKQACQILKFDILDCFHNLITNDNKFLYINRMAYAINALYPDKSLNPKSLEGYCTFLLEKLEDCGAAEGQKKNVRDNIKAVKLKLAGQPSQASVNAGSSMSRSTK